MVNNVGIVISEEDLASGPGTRLDHLRNFVPPWQTQLQVSRNAAASLAVTQGS